MCGVRDGSAWARLHFPAECCPAGSPSCCSCSTWMWLHQLLPPIPAFPGTGSCFGFDGFFPPPKQNEVLIFLLRKDSSALSLDVWEGVRRAGLGSASVCAVLALLRQSRSSVHPGAHTWIFPCFPGSCCAMVVFPHPWDTREGFLGHPWGTVLPSLGLCLLVSTAANERGLSLPGARAGPALCPSHPKPRARPAGDPTGPLSPPHTLPGFKPCFISFQHLTKAIGGFQLGSFVQPKSCWGLGMSGCYMNVPGCSGILGSFTAKAWPSDFIPKVSPLISMGIQ